MGSRISLQPQKSFPASTQYQTLGREGIGAMPLPPVHSCDVGQSQLCQLLQILKGNMSANVARFDRPLSRLPWQKAWKQQGRAQDCQSHHRRTTDDICACTRQAINAAGLAHPTG
mmetsp:Transcript_45030/g.94114  ORF Transcript_45030/g.94114 Transcript_45030/m.94114 type:complete len:115 (-) Transcript_45030:39-383(-)